MTILDFVKEQLASYEEENQPYMIYIYEDETEVGHEWIQNFQGEFLQYMNKVICRIEYFTEAAYVYLKR